MLVIGAGALGNEILKNLRHCWDSRKSSWSTSTASRSRISHARCFIGRKISAATRQKSQRVAQVRSSRIRGTASRRPMSCTDAALDLFEWSDVIVAGLDNREARLWINRSAWKVNRPWIDGAIEGNQWCRASISAWRRSLLRMHPGRSGLGPPTKANVLQPADSGATVEGKIPNHSNDLLDYCGRPGARSGQADSRACRRLASKGYVFEG